MIQISAERKWEPPGVPYDRYVRNPPVVPMGRRNYARYIRVETGIVVAVDSESEFVFSYVR